MMEDFDIHLQHVKVGAHGEIHACVKGDDVEEVTMYEELMMEMNDHFNNTQLLSIIPHIPAQNEVCAAKYDSIWHRVRVSVVLTKRAGQYANCFFMDGGQEESISLQQLRVLPEKFKSVPYQVKRVFLHGVQPASMMISQDDLMVTNQPVIQWDEAAVRFIKDSIKAANDIRCSVLDQMRDGSLSVRMYLERRSGAYMCLNEILVNNKFAVLLDTQMDPVDQVKIRMSTQSSNKLVRMMNQSSRPVQNGFNHELAVRSDTELTMYHSQSQNGHDADAQGYFTDSQGVSAMSHRSLHRSPADVPHRRNSLKDLVTRRSLSPQCNIKITNPHYTHQSDSSSETHQHIAQGKSAAVNSRRDFRVISPSQYRNDCLSTSSDESFLLNSKSLRTSPQTLLVPQVPKITSPLVSDISVDRTKIGRGITPEKIKSPLATKLGLSPGEVSPRLHSPGISVGRGRGSVTNAILKSSPFSGGLAACSDSEICVSSKSPAASAAKHCDISSTAVHTSPATHSLSAKGPLTETSMCYSNGYESENVLTSYQASAMSRPLVEGASPVSALSTDRTFRTSASDLPESARPLNSSGLSASLFGRGGFTKSRLPKEVSSSRKPVEVALESGMVNGSQPLGTLSPRTVDQQANCLKSPITSPVPTSRPSPSNQEYPDRSPTPCQSSGIQTLSPRKSLQDSIRVPCEQKNEQNQARFLEQTVSDKKMELLGKMTGRNLLEKLAPSTNKQSIETKSSPKSIVDHGTSGVKNVLVHGSRPPKPFFRMRDDIFKEQVNMHWKECEFSSPFLIQSYTWPVILRGRNIVAISPPSTGKTLAYLYPLITFLSDTKMYEEIPKGMGPHVVILAPTWHQAQIIYDITYDIIGGRPDLRVHLVHGGGNEDNKACTLINGCEILVATPPSLRRIVENGYTDLHRLCHMVFDDADRLLKTYYTEIKELLKLYTDFVQQKMRKSSCPRQFLVFGAQWNEAVEQFMENCLHEPVLILTSASEASVYGKVLQVPHMCRSENRMKQLLALLENMDPDKDKIIIFSSSEKEIVNIDSMLRSCSHYCLSVTPSMEMFSVQHVRDEWRQKLPLMVCCDEYIVEMDIQDATAVINYDLPNSKTKFSNRLACMMKYFYNFNAKNKEAPGKRPVSHLIVTERCEKQMTSLMDFLLRSRATITPQLESFMEGIIEGREENRDKELCTSKLAFGFCREKWRCRYRHSVITDVDVPTTTDWLPSEGEVQILVTHVQNASRYFARMLSVRLPDRPSKDLSLDYSQLRMDLSLYYSDINHQIRMTSPEAADVCGYQENEAFFRVQILGVRMMKRDKHKSPYMEAKVKFVDNGRVDCVSAHNLYELPENLRNIPFQAVEVFVCNVKPKDKDSEWTPKASAFVNRLVHSQVFEGKIVMRLGNILWLDPLVMRVNLGEARCIINKFYVSKELINNGLADNNPSHLPKLLKFCDGHVTVPTALLIKTNSSPAVHTDVLPACRQYHEVYVSAVSDPGLFYLQRKEKAQELEELMTDLSRYIEGLDLEDENSHTFTTEEYCLAEYTSYDQRWYRGRIICEEEDKYEVFFADYGDRDVVPKNKVRKFPYDKFCELPLQAIECTLAHITHTGETFDEVSGDYVWDFSHYVNSDIKVLMAEVLEGDRQPAKYGGHQKFVVQLTDTTGASDLNLSQELVWSQLVLATEGSGLQSLYTHKKKKMYSSPLENVPDLCVTLYMEQDEPKALDVAGQMFSILQNILQKLAAGSLNESFLKTSLVCQMCITKLIGHVRDGSVHSQVLDCLHVLLQLGDRLSVEFINSGGVQSLVRCLERNGESMYQHQTAEVTSRLARVSNRLKARFQQPVYLRVLSELFETTECQQTQGSVCLAFSALCTGSDSVFSHLMQQGICQKLSRRLAASSEHHTVEGVLVLVATLTEHDSNHGDVLKESLIEAIVKKLEKTSCDKCIQLSVQQCDNFAATRRKHKTFLLEMHMVQVLNRLLGLELQSSTSQLCKDLLSSLVVKVPSEPMVRQYERPDTSKRYPADSSWKNPEVRWSQNTFCLILSIKVAGADPSQDIVKFTGNTVSFKAITSSQRYSFLLRLYDLVLVERCKVAIKPQLVLVSLKKVNKGRWPRLLHDKEDKPNYLSIDFERMVDSSDDEEVSDDDRPFNLQAKQKEKCLPAMTGTVEPRVKPGEVATDSEEDTDDSLEDARDPDLRDQNYFEPFN